MAFVRTDLACMAYGGGNHLWFYRTNDTAAVVDSADYFLTAINDINVGDVLFIYADIDGTPAFGAMVCNANSGTAIDFADLTNFAAADTD